MTKTQVILGCFLLNEDLDPKDFGINKSFFKNANERFVFSNLDGKRDITIIADKLSGKIRNCHSYLSGLTTAIGKTTPANPERVKLLINEVKRERLQTDVAKKLDTFAKTGNVDHDKIREYYDEIEELDFDKDEIPILSADKVKLKSVVYDWPLRIPKNKLTLFTGKPSRYKSGLLAYLASRYTTGRDWPFSKNHTKGSVLILSCEDDIQDTLGPRLKIAGCDMSKIKIITEPLDLNFDLPKIKKIAKRIPDLCAIQIDPINKYSGNIQLDKMENLNPFLLKLMIFSKTFPITIHGVHHTRKDSRGDPMDMILGSRAWSASPRVIHGLEYDRDGKTMLFLPIKNNLAPQQKTLSFKIRTKRLEEIDSEVPYCADFQISEKTAKDAMTEDAETIDSQNAFDECKDIILETLKDGRLAAIDFEESVMKAGVSLSVFQKTRAKLKNQNIIDPDKSMGCWFWDLKR